MSGSEDINPDIIKNMIKYTLKKLMKEENMTVNDIMPYSKDIQNIIDESIKETFQDSNIDIKISWVENQDFSEN